MVAGAVIQGIRALLGGAAMEPRDGRCFGPMLRGPVAEDLAEDRLIAAGI
jgi:hypothetical protein